MRRAAGACVLVLALAITHAASALQTTARSGPVTATITLEPDDPVIGDPMVLRIEAVADEGVELLMPDFGEALDRFRIVDFVPRSSIDDAGRTVASQRYTLQAPASGDHLLPSILIEFVDRRPGQDPAPEGEDAYELLSESLPFTVESVVPEAADADLAPPLGRLPQYGPGSRTPWPWLIGALALLAVAAPFALRALRSMRARAEVRSAYELARGELDALLAGPKPVGEAVDEFFVELSSIVRRHIERRFAVRSPEMTTERFLETASDSPDLTDEHQDLLRDFLRQCDLVKFAHYIPSSSAIDEATDLARRFIEDTRDDAPDPDGHR